MMGEQKLYRLAALRHEPGNWLWRWEARVRGVELGAGVRLIGRPLIRRRGGSIIRLHDGVQIFSKYNSNPLGPGSPSILRTLTAEAVIEMGERSGMSGAILCAGKGIRVGHDTLLGAGCMIIDNDFHRWEGDRWTNEFSRNAKPVMIGDGVFVGARATILKGVTIGNYAVIGAGAVVTKDVPSHAIVAGNPARVVGGSPEQISPMHTNPPKPESEGSASRQ